MSIQNWPGGVISKTPPTPSGPFENSTASGVWTIQQAADYVKQGNWPTAGNVPPDPFFENVTMLLHGDGTNGGQNNTFLDASTNNFTITRNGNTTQGSFSPYGPNWSNSFDGSGDALVVNGSTAGALALTGDFTIEAWVYLNSISDTVQVIGSHRFGVNASWAIFLASDRRLVIYYNISPFEGVSTATVPLQSWTHVAFTRSGSSCRGFINGVQVCSMTNSGSIGTNPFNVSVGGDIDGNYSVNGFISNARVVKGTAVYTANFTPSTTPLTAISGTSLLTCADNRFIDDSTNNFAITRTGNVSVQRFSPFAPPAAYSTATIGGSGYFDGSGDWLAAPSITLSGDFTIEGWINQTSFGQNSPLISIGSDTQNSGTVLLYLSTNNGTAIAIINNSISGGSATSFGTWNHIALVRSGSTITLYQNGVSQFTSSVTTTISGPVNIGSTVYASARGFGSGYASDVRITTTAVYTANFTPPTAPLTAVTNTQLLTNMTNAAIFDNAMMNDLETVGNAQISTSVVKFGTGSMAFDGSGDWLTGNFPSRDLYSFGTGDFTVEMWVYTSNLSNFQTLLDTRATDSQTSWCLFLDNTGKPYWYDASGVQLSSTAISSNAWTHLAVSRSGSTLRMFLSGTQVFSGTNTNSQNPTGPFYVARNAVNAFLYTGYIDDLRITKGVARYTATFTPPTAAFPNL